MLRVLSRPASLISPFRSSGACVLSGNGFARQPPRRCFGTLAQRRWRPGQAQCVPWGGVNMRRAMAAPRSRGSPGLDEAATHAWATEPDRGGDGFARFPGDVAADEIIRMSMSVVCGPCVQPPDGERMGTSPMGIVATQRRCTIALPDTRRVHRDRPLASSRPVRHAPRWAWCAAANTSTRPGSAGRWRPQHEARDATGQPAGGRHRRAPRCHP